jgi:hypothetical protein
MTKPSLYAGSAPARVRAGSWSATTAARTSAAPAACSGARHSPKARKARPTVTGGSNVERICRGCWGRRGPSRRKARDGERRTDRGGAAEPQPGLCAEREVEPAGGERDRCERCGGAGHDERRQRYRVELGYGPVGDQDVGRCRSLRRRAPSRPRRGRGRPARRRRARARARRWRSLARSARSRPSAIAATVTGAG